MDQCSRCGAFANTGFVGVCSRCLADESYQRRQLHNEQELINVQHAQNALLREQLKEMERQREAEEQREKQAAAEARRERATAEVLFRAGKCLREAEEHKDPVVRASTARLILKLLTVAGLDGRMLPTLEQKEYLGNLEANACRILDDVPPELRNAMDSLDGLCGFAHELEKADVEMAFPNLAIVDAAEVRRRLLSDNLSGLPPRLSDDLLADPFPESPGIQSVAEPRVGRAVATAALEVIVILPIVIVPLLAIALQLGAEGPQLRTLGVIAGIAGSGGIALWRILAHASEVNAYEEAVAGKQADWDRWCARLEKRVTAYNRWAAAQRETRSSRVRTAEEAKRLTLADLRAMTRALLATWPGLATVYARDERTDRPPRGPGACPS